MIRIFNNICFKSKTFLLIAFVSFLSQSSFAQNNVSGSIMINGALFSSTSAFNYHFYLSNLIFSQEGADIERLFNGEVMNVAEDIYQPFIELGINPQYFHRYSLTPLIYAVVHEDVEAVDFILDQEGVDPNLRDSNDMAPLVWAAITGNEDIVRTLVSAGMIFSQLQGDAAIKYAEEKGNTRIAEYLRGIL